MYVLYELIVAEMEIICHKLYIGILLALAVARGALGELSKHAADCELEGLNIATRLADRFNSFDEHTEQDVRIHHDYLVKYLGFAGWIQNGLWKNTKLTANRQNTVDIYKVQ